MRFLKSAGKILLSFTLIFWAGAASGDRLFIGIMEADGYQAVLLGASAFSRVSDLPLALELVRSGLNECFHVPSFSCISPSDIFRVVQTVDPKLPRGEENPANVAILPMAEGDASVHRVFEDAYTTHTSDGPITCYEKPRTTNLAARVAVAITGRHLLTSTSEDALRWAWENRSKLVEAPPQNIPGTIRVLVNPQRFADLIGSRSEPVAAFFNVDKMLRDFDTLSFSFSLDGQAVGLAARGKPKTGSDLDTLSKALRPPLSKLWNGLPNETFVAAVSACDSQRALDVFCGPTSFRLLRPYSDSVPPEAFSGDRLLYLVATPDKRGLCLVRVEPVKHAERVREAIRSLHLSKLDGGIILKPEPSHRVGDVQVETYSLKFQQAASAGQGDSAANGTSTLYSLVTLLLKQAVLESAVTDSHLITVLGLPHSIDEQMECLKFRDKDLPLNRKITAQDPALNARLCQGVSLQPSSLMRQIVTIMPGVKPEHLHAFPAGGDGITFGICADEDHSLAASIRLQSSEIAALQKINKDGREVLQELVFQLFSSQMLNMQKGSKTGENEQP